MTLVPVHPLPSQRYHGPRLARRRLRHDRARKPAGAPGRRPRQEQGAASGTYVYPGTRSAACLLMAVGQHPTPGGRLDSSGVRL